jgi:hypothetical protein
MMAESAGRPLITEPQCIGGAPKEAIVLSVSLAVHVVLVDAESTGLMFSIPHLNSRFGDSREMWWKTQRADCLVTTIGLYSSRIGCLRTSWPI